MCEKGNTKQTYIFDLNKVVDVDACIEPIIRGLNSIGQFNTIASCCGHGKRPGYVKLADGREIIIAPDYDTARQIEGCLPLIYPESISMSDIRECCPHRGLVYSLIDGSTDKAVIRCYRCSTVHYGPLHKDKLTPVWEYIKANTD